MTRVDSSRGCGLQRRYAEVTRKKAGGATYTPWGLADFVAREICKAIPLSEMNPTIHVADPAVGHGQLLISLLREIEHTHSDSRVIASGFETDGSALQTAASNIRERFPSVEIDFQQRDFLEFVLELCPGGEGETLFGGGPCRLYDLIIANPPYVRTQIMGAGGAQRLCERFNLAGRVDLYHAFVLAMAHVLKPHGTAGIIVSNRFMTTKSGESLRRAISQRFNIRHVWDLGDTKLFDAAVLPAVLLLHGKATTRQAPPSFSSIYLTEADASAKASDPVDALCQEGVVAIPDGRHFRVQHGTLDMGKSFKEPWRVATTSADSWLSLVGANTWGTFRDIGKIRVGVKTCADSVFIRSDWSRACPRGEPELLRPLVTHHVARRFKAIRVSPPRMILYPHEANDGSRNVVDISNYPLSQDYLEKHRAVLSARKYVTDAGREWYEIWVPQDPAAWQYPKLVFRDIAQRPTFWIDMHHSVVNGDCYWLTTPNPAEVDLLWLAAAVANSTFIEVFYDRKFNNKLYAGRRRFMTQYVEQFPLPDPKSVMARALVDKAKRVYDLVPSPEAHRLEDELDVCVWKAFGLTREES